MRLVFFDIECCNGHDICSFGYVITDEKFKIIKKEDIVINPESKIILAQNGKPAKFQLAYSQEYFLKQNPFDFYYEKIKKILTNPKHLVFGHSIGSDYGFLNIACRRYKLPIINIKGYDTQKFYKKIYRSDHVLSLEKIVEQLGIEKDFIYHKSSEDAEAVMQILKYIVRDKELDKDSLLLNLEDCQVINDSNKVQEKKVVRFSEKVELLRKNYKDNLKTKVAFSDGFRYLTEKERLEIIENIFKHGYDYTNKISDCDIFVLDEKREKRFLYFKHLQKEGKNIKGISKDEFADILKSSKDIDLSYTL